MRICSYQSERGIRAGLMVDDRVVDAWDALGEAPERASVRALLAQDRLDELRAIDNPVDAAGLTGLAAPIPDPDKIICIGLNYRTHATEAGLEPPQVPTFFAKFRNALVGDDATVRLPPASKKVDYEAEIAFVIGSRANQVPVEQALKHLAGYMLFNDLSARDLQFATPQWIPGKVFDGSAPCGPALVTSDEAGPDNELEFSLTLNGEQMQGACTDDLIFSVPQLLSHLSQLMTLEPGDVVSTGTPAGVGSVREPRVWLADGDSLQISSPTLGALTTHIAR